jgi:hypothetical protein
MAIYWCFYNQEIFVKCFLHTMLYQRPSKICLLIMILSSYNSINSDVIYQISLNSCVLPRYFVYPNSLKSRLYSCRRRVSLPSFIFVIVSPLVSHLTQLKCLFLFANWGMIRFHHPTYRSLHRDCHISCYYEMKNEKNTTLSEHFQNTIDKS